MLADSLSTDRRHSAVQVVVCRYISLCRGTRDDSSDESHEETRPTAARMVCFCTGGLHYIGYAKTDGGMNGLGSSG